jgi:hypothetical protein
MNLHYKATLIPITRRRELLNATNWNHTLHSILRVKSSNALIIELNIHSTSPDIVIVDITNWVASPGRSNRRGLPVEAIRVYNVDNIWNGHMEDIKVPSPDLVVAFLSVIKVSLPAPVFPANINLVVSIPHGNRRMIP